MQVIHDFHTMCFVQSHAARSESQQDAAVAQKRGRMPSAATDLVSSSPDFAPTDIAAAQPQTDPQTPQEAEQEQEQYSSKADKPKRIGPGAEDENGSDAHDALQELVWLLQALIWHLDQHVPGKLALSVPMNQHQADMGMQLQKFSKARSSAGLWRQDSWDAYGAANRIFLEVAATSEAIQRPEIDDEDHLAWFSRVQSHHTTTLKLLVDYLWPEGHEHQQSSLQKLLEHTTPIIQVVKLLCGFQCCCLLTSNPSPLDLLCKHSMKQQNGELNQNMLYGGVDTVMV